MTNREQISIITKSSHTSTYHDNRYSARTLCLYALDWLTAVIAVSVSQIIAIPCSRTTRFLITDPSIQQIFHDDKVDINRVGVVLMTAIPVVIMLLWLGYRQRPFIEFHSAILGLANALSFSILFTMIGKQAGMILSPDFLGRCMPSADAIERSRRTGSPMTLEDCTGSSSGAIKQGIRAFPTIPMVLSSCSMGYLSLFASVHLGLRLHPSVQRRLQMTAIDGRVDPLRPGQTLISFICLLPLAAGMALPAVETVFHGGGHGWGYAFSGIIGLGFALWAHTIYVAKLPMY
ncbi:hypothetical protein GQ54DRAFT_288916 [Martensiomyces pterosporus]|nr:hypothetical protein GQ54DRAFT_288916 [Martensiomyces pterosporus]